jgi:nitrous oxidase accessory protein NosD
VKFSGNCHDNLIEKCIIRNIRNRGIFSSTRKEYANNFPHDIEIFNCDIYDVGVDTAGADISLGRNCTNFIIKGNRLHGRIDGVVMEDASSGHVIIENIIFDHYEEDGIDIKNTYKKTLNAKSDTILIKNNIIFNHPKQTGITIQKGSKNILIEGNFITKARWGIWIRSHDTSHVSIFENNIVSNFNIGIVINGDAKGNVIIKDNFITENGTIAMEMVSAGIAIYAGENYEIFSNTISRNSLCNGLNEFNLQLIIGIDQVYTTTLYMNKYHYAKQDKIIKWGENYYNLHDFQKIEKQDKNPIFQKDTKFLKPKNKN